MKFSTFDVYEASWLIAQGCRVLETRQGRLVEFIFDGDNGQAARLANIWWSGSTVMSAREYAAAEREARRLIRETPWKAA